MPELPDLEVIAERLESLVCGRRIESVRCLRPGILKTLAPPLESLIGKELKGISRRGKFLILSVDRALHMVVHLMRCGRFVACMSNTKPTKATALIVSFSDGEDLRLIENGPVKKAAVNLVVKPGDVEGIAEAGCEPISEEFTLERLLSMVEGRPRQAKKLLTDQRMMAGIGTAYADEILFDARISPVRYVSKLSSDETARLHRSIRTVLSDAVEKIGSRTGERLPTEEIRDFLKVYKRTGEPCPACGTPIAEIRHSRTRTYYCPNCQTRGTAIPDRRSWMNR